MIDAMSSGWRQALFSIVPFLAVAMGMAVTFYLMRNRLPLSPRQVRRQNTWTTPFVVAMFLLAAAAAWNAGQRPMSIVMSVLALVSLAGRLAGHSQTTSAREAKQNYAAEPGRCGQCEYDLTGNTSGVCPECGWQIPRDQLDVDSPGWAMWWRKWEIDRLENWRRTLRFLSVMILLFLLLGVSGAAWFGLPALAMPAVMAVLFGMNAWRVIQYGRKHNP